MKHPAAGPETARGLLELDGEVRPKDLHAIWAGEHPTTGGPLGRFPNRKVAGFDLTFRAPKSVSILAGLGDPDTARAVREAHESALDAAFAYLERKAARSRTGKNGVHQIEVNGTGRMCRPSSPS